MAKYRIEIKDNKKVTFIKELLKDFGLVEESPDCFTDDKRSSVNKKQTTTIRSRLSGNDGR